MMIQRIVLAAVVASGVGVAQAQFNTDALKTMQQQGHEIVEQSKSGRAYKGQGNLCLDVAGSGLVVKQCSQAATQKWRMDEKKRLVAHSGQCVTGANLRQCGDAKSQVFTHDGKQRLVNGSNQCLQIQGNSPKPGTAVTAAACSNAASQVWR